MAKVCVLLPFTFLAKYVIIYISNECEVFNMTANEVKAQELALNQELALIQKKFPNWNLFYEFNDSISDPAETVKAVVKEMKLKYPDYKFSICKNSYGCLLLLNIKSVDKSEDFAYYGGNSCGYIVCNDMYKTLSNEFKNHADITLFGIRVETYIENSKTMQLAFTKC
jgi:hypothetical protein